MPALRQEATPTYKPTIETGKIKFFQSEDRYYIDIYDHLDKYGVEVYSTRFLIYYLAENKESILYKEGYRNY
jgi:hypothetical protein